MRRKLPYFGDVCIWASGWIVCVKDFNGEWDDFMAGLPTRAAARDLARDLNAALDAHDRRMKERKDA